MLVYTLENLLLILSLVGIAILLYYEIDRVVDLFLEDEPASAVQLQQMEADDTGTQPEEAPQAETVQQAEAHANLKRGK